ncbi:MAG: hypothetical protein M1546_26815 [Chloroflexi bacterium]|nr:hypothetical protein [Chloroflexota bacterium]
MSEHRSLQQATPDPRAQTMELLSPSLQRYTPYGAGAEEARPWTMDGQLWIAFFGGVIPVTVIAYLNTRRLRIPFTQSWKMIAAGGVGLCAVILITALPCLVSLPAFLTTSTLPLTAAGRLIALLVYVYLRRLQVSALRVYHWYYHGELSSLWGAGLAAVIILGLLQLGLIDWAAWLLAGMWR